MNNSDNIIEVVGALLAAQAEFEVLSKSSDNPFYHSKYIALPDLVVAVNPTLTKHGLGISQLVSNIDGQSALTTILFHTSGQYISSTTPLLLSKNDPQAHGSAITYMRRYAYMSILGLVADEDDDGNASSVVNNRQTTNSSQSRPAPANNGGASLASKVASAAGSGKGITENQSRAIWAITHKTLNMDDSAMLEAIAGIINREVGGLDQLTLDEAKILIETFKTQANQ